MSVCLCFGCMPGPRAPGCDARRGCVDKGWAASVGWADSHGGVLCLRLSVGDSSPGAVGVLALGCNTPWPVHGRLLGGIAPGTVPLLVAAVARVTAAHAQPQLGRRCVLQAPRVRPRAGQATRWALGVGSGSLAAGSAATFYGVPESQEGTCKGWGVISGNV